MLPSILIRNFRLFKDLKIDRLGRVNLITGQNNAGKTAFLEAIRLYASSGSIDVLLNLIKVRQEDWQDLRKINSITVDSHPIRHLFYNYQLLYDSKKCIHLGPIDTEDKQLKFYVQRKKSQKTEQAGYSDRYVVVRYLEPNLFMEDTFYLVISLNDKPYPILLLDRSLEFEAPRLRRISESKSSTVYIPTNNLSSQELADLWDQIIFNNNKDEEVIRALQLLDPSVRGITFVKNRTTPRERIPIIKTEKFREPLPLKSMGDGMMRLFHIIISLVNASQGTLLIDEFETGLHWSVQPRIWKTVFRLAKDLNVQVFATTHSRDCIAAFEEAWKEEEEVLGAFFRLNRDKIGDINVTPYTRETLSDALEMDVEIR